MYMFDHLSKASINNLKEILLGSISYFDWEKHPLKHHFLKNTVYTASMNTNQRDRISWKTICAMILANYTK